MMHEDNDSSMLVDLLLLTWHQY